MALFLKDALREVSYFVTLVRQEVYMPENQLNKPNVPREEPLVSAEALSRLETVEDSSSDEANEQNERFYEEEYEEPSQEESEEDVHPTYQANNEGIAAIGDNARLNIESYIQIVQVFHQRASDSDETKESTSEKQDELIKQALAFAQQSNTFPVQPVDATTDITLLTDETKIADWYYTLDIHTQCYVQVAAILHGAPAHEVSIRADTLYTRFLEEGDLFQNASPLDKSPSGRQQEVLPISTYSNRSSRKLQEKTHTITQRIEGVERLFWEDVDIYGISSFGLQVLDFFAGEYISQGIHGQNLFNILFDWSQENHAESSWRSAYALGVFLWHQNADALRRKATPLAKEKSQSSRNRVASLLEGAYELESIKFPEKATSVHVSSVLRLLHEWIEDKVQYQTDVYLKCAAANTLERIGKRKPDVAFAHLERLLQEPPGVSVASTNVFYASLISAYVTLSRSGHIQTVFAHLARIAEQAILQSNLPHQLRQRQIYRRQCEVKLQIVSKAFLLIAVDSSYEASQSEALQVSSRAYIEPLSDPLSLSNSQSCDVVLVGLLNEIDSPWRKQLISMLSAAIYERQSRLLALGVMQQWAETVLKMQEEQSIEAKLLLASYKHFMIQVDETLGTWALDLEKRQGRLLETRAVYKQQLKMWRSKHHNIQSLVRDVLS